MIRRLQRLVGQYGFLFVIVLRPHAVLMVQWFDGIPRLPELDEHRGDEPDQ